MLKGTVKLNGDKSISHRILLFGALASGGCTVYNLSTCQDVQRTINILKNCNIKISKENNKTTEPNPRSFKQQIQNRSCFCSIRTGALD